jgi:mannan endo-1,4-beta-mannosidase
MVLALSILLLALASYAAVEPIRLLTPRQMESFVKTNGTMFALDNKPFYWGGTNNYYLFYAKPEDADALLDDAVKTRASVVRTWLFSDGKTYPGGNNRPRGEVIWFQDINSKGEMEFNDDMEYGLGRFDRVLASARRRGIKLIVTLANNWNDFGGIDVYVDRLGTQQKYHTEFFYNPTIKAAFKQYIKHVLNRRNSITGVLYKDDPTIMGIELMNEPRCEGTNRDGRYPRDPNCNVNMITSWANEMSTYIKTEVDPNHLIGVGDEGFWYKGPTYPNAYSNLWDGWSGTDFVALSKLPNIDMIGIHSYFDHWGTNYAPLFLENTKKWIRDHAVVAKELNKPIYLGEYGSENKQQRLIDFPEIQKVAEESGYAGTALWMLVSSYEGRPYPDFSQYHYFASDRGINQITLDHAQRMWNRSFK